MNICKENSISLCRLSKELLLNYKTKNKKLTSVLRIYWVWSVVVICREFGESQKYFLLSFHQQSLLVCKISQG